MALGGATLETVRAVVAPGANLACAGADTAPQTWHPGARASLRLLARVGLVDPTSIDDYRALGGYAALRRAIDLGTGRHDPVRSPTRSSSAAAAPRSPPGSKWKAVAEQSVRPHYVICNADESEPGTFKDRVVMEHDPFAVVEALTIAGFATGAETRLPLHPRGVPARAPNGSSTRSTRRDVTGCSAMTSVEHGFRFDIELRRGAGAYICGEETALFNSIEGKRGEPRNKPPFPVTHGVFGKPTAINNVETLINVLPILDARRGGVRRGRHRGTPPAPGCSACRGHVERPGVYEHPHGVTLGEAIEAAGGVRGGTALKAVLLGGAAGGFVGPDRLDARLTFEDARAGGYTLGSGVIMVFDEDTDLVDLCLRIARFFRDESCGQCVPCRVGHRAAGGGAAPAGRAAARSARRPTSSRCWKMSRQVMRDASICGLGQTAASAVQSAIVDVRAVRRGRA